MHGAVSEAFQQFEAAPTGRMLALLELPLGATALLRGVGWHSYKEDPVSILVRIQSSQDVCFALQLYGHRMSVVFSIEKY